MRTTRKALAAFGAAAALTLTACGGGGDGGDGGSTEGGADGGGGGESVRIGIKFDQPGLGLQEGDSFTGFDVDVAKYVAGELGYSEDQIEWVSAPSANRETLLVNGQVDMIFATYSITDERDEQVDFAGPYFIAGQDLLVRADSEVTGPADLAGQNLCSVTGSTSAQNIQEEYTQEVNLLEQPSYAECVSAMQGGNIDAVTTDDIILAGLAADPAYEGDFKVVGNTFSEERYGVGLPPDNDICEDVNDAIRQMIEDGSWREFLDSNLEGINFEPNADLNPPEPQPCGD